MKFLFLSKKAIIRVVIAMLVVAVIIAVVGLTQTSGVFLNKPLSKNSPINSLSTETKSIVISVEINSDIETNTAILDAVTRENVAFIVFIQGQIVEINKDLLKKLSSNDKVSFGTNGNILTDNTVLTTKEMLQEIRTGREILEKSIGKKIEYYRAPFGKYNDNLIDVVKKEGLFPIGGDIDTIQYKNENTANLAKKLISRVKSGSIINVSSLDTNAVSIIPLGISGLQAGLGFKIGKIDDLIIRENYIITSAGRQENK